MASSSSGSASSSTGSIRSRDDPPGRSISPRTVSDRLALGVGQVQEARVQVNFPEPLVGVAGASSSKPS